MPDTPYEHFPHTVSVKLNWADEEWEEVENLFADSFVESCAPDISKAVLHWRYGQVQSYGEGEFSTRDKLDYTDYYVKIELEQGEDDEGDPIDPIKWYGIIVSDTRELDGAVTVDGARVPSGTQKILALGLEYLLTRKQVDTSVVSDGAGGEDTIKRAIPFNMGTGNSHSHRYQPNMGDFGS